ncbi:regulatory protein GemA [Azospirillum halopraeferens]|uniref:regulatory protein GemA n=1 Tax=Azospirillum halopraeferens TaxID=34010 RepID=UPI0004068D50|nr:regulatory protein GemA [Azospirillum halopraeferens]
MKPDTTARLIAAVQTCRRKVAGLDDDTAWRDFLERTGGKRSLRAMTGPQLGRVLDALHAAGAPRRSAGRPRYADSAQVRMMRGLWLELADLGAVQSRAEGALNAFIKRQTGQDVGRLDTTAAHKVIEALKRWVGRAQAKAGGARAS